VFFEGIFMRQINGRDIRDVLKSDKAFGMRPFPLQRVIYQQKISQICERVFWLHWDLGQLNPEYLSRISIAEVSELVIANASSVTRAYKTLTALGLLRRISGGRKSDDQFRCEVSVTEALPLTVPHVANALIDATLHAPIRARTRTIEKDVSSVAETSTCTPLTDDSAETALAQQFFDEHGARKVYDVVAKQMSAEELLRFNTLIRHPFEHLERPWAREQTSRVTDAANAWVLQYLRKEVSKARAQQLARPAGEPARKPRPRLSELTLTYLRSHLARVLKSQDLNRVATEAAWSILHGSFAKMESTRHAIHSIGKLVKEGRWKRPTKMPAEWLVTTEVAGICRAA
jgi:hypothetical protein